VSAVDLPNVCLLGGAGAGKTTVANLLEKYFGYVRVSFAEPLKIMLDTTTDRARLQEFGTDVVRAYEPDAWVRLFFYLNELRFDEFQPPLVVDDTRFRNEVDALVQAGWVTCRVVAPTATRIRRLKANGKLQDEAQLLHSSELELADYEAQHRIHNDGWIDFDLLPDVEDFVNKIRLP